MPNVVSKNINYIIAIQLEQPMKPTEFTIFFVVVTTRSLRVRFEEQVHFISAF